MCIVQLQGTRSRPGFQGLEYCPSIVLFFALLYSTIPSNGTRHIDGSHGRFDMKTE